MVESRKEVALGQEDHERQDILSQVSENITAGTVLTYNLSNYIRQPLPKIYHGTAKPSIMESLLSEKRSRL